MTDLNDTLKERGGRYGELKDNGKVSQGIKDVMRASIQWNNLTPDKKEALDMIASKISRIVTGDPEYKDNWVDCAGYATLIIRSLDHED